MKMIIPVDRYVWAAFGRWRYMERAFGRRPLTTYDGVSMATIRSNRGVKDLSSRTGRDIRSLLLGIVFVLLFVRTAEAEEGLLSRPKDPGPIATDRPGNGNAASAVRPLELNVETSALFAVDKPVGGDRIRAITFPTGLRLGVMRGVEFRVGTAWLAIFDERSDATVRGTDFDLGFKVQLVSGAGWIPTLALQLQVNVPVGGAPATLGGPVPEGRLLTSWALPVGFALLTNVGFDVPDPDTAGSSGFARAIYLVNLGYTLPIWQERFALFVEGYGRIGPRDAVSIHQVDYGVTCLVQADLQLDLFLQHGLTEASTDFQAALGVSYRFSL